jgi:hypothetical protein
MASHTTLRCDRHNFLPMRERGGAVMAQPPSSTPLYLIYRRDQRPPHFCNNCVLSWRRVTTAVTRHGVASEFHFPPCHCRHYLCHSTNRRLRFRRRLSSPLASHFFTFLLAALPRQLSSSMFAVLVQSAPPRHDEKAAARFRHHLL